MTCGQKRRERGCARGHGRGGAQKAGRPGLGVEQDLVEWHVHEALLSELRGARIGADGGLQGEMHERRLHLATAVNELLYARHSQRGVDRRDPGIVESVQRHLRDVPRQALCRDGSHGLARRGSRAANVLREASSAGLEGLGRVAVAHAAAERPAEVQLGQEMRRERVVRQRGTRALHCLARSRGRRGTRLLARVRAQVG